MAGLLAVALTLALRGALDDPAVQVTGPLADRLGTVEWRALEMTAAPLRLGPDETPAVAAAGDVWTIDYLSHDCDRGVAVVVRDHVLTVLPNLGTVCGNVAQVYRLRLTWQTEPPPSLTTSDVRFLP